jgi:hypothetical protein
VKAYQETEPYEAITAQGGEVALCWFECSVTRRTRAEADTVTPNLGARSRYEALGFAPTLQVLVNGLFKGARRGITVLGVL